MSERLFGIFRHQSLELCFRALVLEKGPSGRAEVAANSAQELEALMSTIRIAAIRGRDGSTPNRRGGSPLSTQRQNFFSAVSKRC